MVLTCLAGWRFHGRLNGWSLNIGLHRLTRLSSVCTAAHSPVHGCRSQLVPKCHERQKRKLVDDFYARQQNASRVFAIVWASVCLSVTLVICIKTVQARITKSSLWAASRSLVFRDKISCPSVRGFPSNEGVKEGYPLKRCYFAVISSYSVKTVADRYRHAIYHKKHL